jgi:hypothetical protein
MKSRASILISRLIDNIKRKEVQLPEDKRTSQVTRQHPTRIHYNTTLSENSCLKLIISIVKTIGNPIMNTNFGNVIENGFPNRKKKLVAAIQIANKNTLPKMTAGIHPLWVRASFIAAKGNPATVVTIKNVLIS